MMALCFLFMEKNCLVEGDFLRIAYYWRFQRDIPKKSLKEDAETMRKFGNVPPYAVEFMVHTYGCAA